MQEEKKDRLEAYATLGVGHVRLGRQEGSIGVPPAGASNRGQVKCLPRANAM